MTTNWTELGEKIGAISEDGESGSSVYASIAFEEILGQEWIENTVEHIVALKFKLGQELAMNCLKLIHSQKAVQYAYNIYKSSNGERASQAVWLIKQIAHPFSYGYIEEFLDDDNVKGWGIGVLDKLLWEEQIQYDSKVEHLLQLAEGKGNEDLQGQVNFIREYLGERGNNSR